MMAEHAETLKRNGIDYDGAMERFGGNAALYERLALKFLDDAHFDALERALADGDADAAVREAHTLKGVAGNLSFTSLYEAAGRVNAALREGDLPGAVSLMEPVRLRPRLAARRRLSTRFPEVAPMKFSNILVPFDKSEHAVRALGIAKGLAEEDPAIQLHVVGIVSLSEIPPTLGLDASPYQSVPPLTVDPDLYRQLADAALAREKEDMDKAIGTLLDGLPNPVRVLAANAPSVVDGINDYAHDHGCDLIVMGSRGLGVLRGMLGSVSYGVLRSSDVPVLIAKEPEKE